MFSITVLRLGLLDCVIWPTIRPSIHFCQITNNFSLNFLTSRINTTLTHPFSASLIIRPRGTVSPWLPRRPATQLFIARIATVHKTVAFLRKRYTLACCTAELGVLITTSRPLRCETPDCVLRTRIKAATFFSALPSFYTRPTTVSFFGILNLANSCRVTQVKQLWSRILFSGTHSSECQIVRVMEFMVWIWIFWTIFRVGVCFWWLCVFVVNLHAIFVGQVLFTAIFIAPAVLPFPFTALELVVVFVTWTREWLFILVIWTVWKYIWRKGRGGRLDLAVFRLKNDFVDSIVFHVQRRDGTDVC